MKKRWETPKAMVEEFEANEYVAACWTVACNVGNGNYGDYGWSYWGGRGLLVANVMIIQEAVVRHPTISLMLMQMGMFLFMRKTAAIRDR